MPTSQCRRQGKQSGGPLAESEGALKQTELLHIKTNTVWLQILRNFKPVGRAETRSSLEREV